MTLLPVWLTVEFAPSIICLTCRYESIIATLCENLDTLDEPEAKASMIWIIGEYAERIDNADELLEQFLETFPEETSLVSHRPEMLAVAVLFHTHTAWYVLQLCNPAQFGLCRGAKQPCEPSALRLH